MSDVHLPSQTSGGEAGYFHCVFWKSFLTLRYSPLSFTEGKTGAHAKWNRSSKLELFLVLLVVAIDQHEGPKCENITTKTNKNNPEGLPSTKN